MIFENGLEFGRNASIINEAYAKMYMNEGDENQPDSVRKVNPLNAHEMRKQRFDNKGISMRNKMSDSDEIVTSDDVGDVTSGFSHGRSRYDHRKVIPDWLRAAAKKNNYHFSDEELNATVGDSDSQSEEPEVTAVEAPKSEYGLDIIDTNMDTSDEKDAEEVGIEDAGDMSAEDNFYENVIEANPDTFNDDAYDMTALASNKKEIMEKSMAFILKGYAPEKAAEMALEDIPGCECKIAPSEEDDGLEESVSRSINEGAGAGYTITVENLKIGNVVSVEKDEHGGYAFTAEIVPGDYAVTANSYYDRYFPLNDFEEDTIHIDGGEVNGFMNYIEDGLTEEEVKAEISECVKRTPVTISSMYGGGWSHSYLPEDGVITLDNVDVKSTQSLDFDLTDVTIHSEKMSEKINYGYKHCNDEEEEEEEEEEEDVESEEIEDSVGNIDQK